MLSVRPPETIKRELTQYCALRKLGKSQVVQEALTNYLVTAKTPPPAKPVPKLSFLAPDDPIRQFMGIAKDGMGTDERMRMTLSDDWTNHDLGRYQSIYRCHPSGPDLAGLVAAGAVQSQKPADRDQARGRCSQTAHPR